MILSDKRKKLFEGFNAWTMNMDWLEEQIEKQDKQFIEQLKEKIKEWHTNSFTIENVLKNIDELTGFALEKGDEQ